MKQRIAAYSTAMEAIQAHSEPVELENEDVPYVFNSTWSCHINNVMKATMKEVLHNMTRLLKSSSLSYQKKDWWVGPGVNPFGMTPTMQYNLWRLQMTDLYSVSYQMRFGSTCPLSGYINSYWVHLYTWIMCSSMSLCSCLLAFIHRRKKLYIQEKHKV